MANHLPCECAGVKKEFLKNIIHHAKFYSPITEKQDIPAQILIDERNSLNNYCYYISIASTTINEDRDDEEERIPEVIMNRIIQTDGTSMFYIISEDSNKYVIANDYKKKDSIIELILVNDTLLLHENMGYKKYVKYSSSYNYNTDDTGNFANISLLNKALLLRNYSSIQSILKEDSLGLDCNGWIGDINMIYSQKDRKSWVLEISDGYLYIKKVVNHIRDPLDPIRTKTVKRLKWDKYNLKE
jgi:hypothetical protein